MNKETAFAHFMANAPKEIPGWYNPDIFEKPKAPDIEPHTGNDELDRLCKNWRMDDCFDLYPPESADPNKYSEAEKAKVKEYEDKWKAYWEGNRRYEEDMKQARYWAWPVYYALEMTARYIENTELAHSGEWIVISYDQDEQQIFFDPVKAENKDDAMTIAGMVRGEYAFICDALSYNELVKMADSFNDPNDWITVKNVRQVIEKYNQSWPYEDDATPEGILAESQPSLKYKCWAIDCKHSWMASRAQGCCPKCGSTNVQDVTYMYVEDLPEPKIPSSDHICRTCNDPDCNRPEGHPLDEHDQEDS